MDRFREIVEYVRGGYEKLKAGNVSIGSLLFLEVVIAFSFIPVVLTVGMLVSILCFHYIDEWAYRFIDTGIKVIDHIWSAQLVAGVLAYAQKLKDTNGDGIPDDFERTDTNDKRL